MRNIKLAIPAAILVLGILSVTACSPRPYQSDASLPVVQTPTPALENFYVPAQHINQATRIEEQPDAF
ncbi:MAG TPA: hypothetical protein VNH16_01120 [Burkholderiales bacterium]|jgi:hypothetical protein|nr:hypothetical protein [Burkholderiales bacterium]